MPFRDQTSDDDDDNNNNNNNTFIKRTVSTLKAESESRWQATDP